MMNADGIRKLLPHREPFLFVDCVTRLDDDGIEAYRDIRADEFYFPGHFPGFPVLPGVLMVEAIAQAGILLVLARRPELVGKKTLFAGIERARFRRQVAPGERLALEAKLLGQKAGLYRFEGRARVGDETACEATVLGVLRE